MGNMPASWDTETGEVNYCTNKLTLQMTKKEVTFLDGYIGKHPNQLSVTIMPNYIRLRQIANGKYASYVADYTVGCKHDRTLQKLSKVDIEYMLWKDTDSDYVTLKAKEHIMKLLGITRQLDELAMSHVVTKYWDYTRTDYPPNVLQEEKKVKAIGVSKDLTEKQKKALKVRLSKEQKEKIQKEEQKVAKRKRKEAEDKEKSKRKRKS